MVFTFENHFQLVRIFLFSNSYFFHELEWQIPSIRKIQHWVLFYGFLWISCINCYWSRSSWFSRLKTISHLYVFYFSPLHIFHKNWNGKYRVSVKYSIRVLFSGFLWISCMNCYWNRSSWISRLKTISNLYVFFFSPLHIDFMSWDGKYQGPVKYSIGVLFYGFRSISCINCYWNRSSGFSQLNTMCNLYIFFYSPIHNFFMSWNGKNRASVKYRMGSYFMD